jgi:hypothetical protein
MEGLHLVEMTHTAVTRDAVWHAVRGARAARRRERDHCLWRRLEGKSGPESAPWVDREAEPMRAGIPALNEAGLHGLERAPSPGRPA